MTLEKQLRATRSEAETNRNKIQIDTMKSTTERLIKEGVEKNVLGVGDKIPSFHLPNIHGQLIEVGNLLIHGPIILTFYRGSWCPYCNLELMAYQENLETIKSHGAQVVAISPELPDKSFSNADKLALNFEVLSDVGNVISRQFGLIFKMPPKLVEVYLQLNCDITKHNGDDSWELPIPATYIIRPDSKIAFSYVNADYLERVDPQQVIVALAELPEQ